MPNDEVPHFKKPAFCRKSSTTAPWGVVFATHDFGADLSLPSSIIFWRSAKYVGVSDWILSW